MLLFLPSVIIMQLVYVLLIYFIVGIFLLRLHIKIFFVEVERIRFKAQMNIWL
jgi:hypothetical protein